MVEHDDRIVAPALEGVPHAFYKGTPEGSEPDLSALGSPPLARVKQVHSARAVTTSAPFSPVQQPEADALVTATPGLALGIVTADCAPVLLHDPTAGVIAAVHAGWRGRAGRGTGGSDTGDGDAWRRPVAHGGCGRPVHPPGELRGRRRFSRPLRYERGWLLCRRTCRPSPVRLAALCIETAARRRCRLRRDAGRRHLCDARMRSTPIAGPPIAAGRPAVAS